MPTFTLTPADNGTIFLSDEDKKGLEAALKSKYPGVVNTVTFDGQKMVVDYTGTIPPDIPESNALNPIFLNTSEGKTFSYQHDGKPPNGGRKSRRRRNMRKKRTMKRKGTRK